MWHGLDRFWDWFYALPFGLRVVLEMLPGFIAIPMLALLCNKLRRVRRWLVRWWILPIVVGCSALHVCVSFGVWMTGVPDQSVYYPPAWERWSSCIPAGSGLMAIVMVSLFLVERGWMTEEPDW